MGYTKEEMERATEQVWQQSGTKEYAPGLHARWLEQASSEAVPGNGIAQNVRAVAHANRQAAAIARLTAMVKATAKADYDNLLAETAATDAVVAERARYEGRIAAMDAELVAMTEDRDLWRGDHNEDCPNFDLAELVRADLGETIITNHAVIAAQGERLREARRLITAFDNIQNYKGFSPNGPSRSALLAWLAVSDTQEVGE